MLEILVTPQNSLQAILIVSAVITMILVVNLVPVLWRPFDMFYTMIHEVGHILAAGLTNGHIVEISLVAGGGGFARTRGGDNALINIAGYLGTALFSATLMILSSLPDFAPYTLTLIGSFSILVVLLYGVRSPLVTLIGLGFGSIFIGVAWLTPVLISIFLLNFLALQGGVATIRHLISLSRNIDGDDDASQMADLAGCTPRLWAALWLFCAVGMLGFAFWFTWLRGLI